MTGPNPSSLFLVLCPIGKQFKLNTNVDELLNKIFIIKMLLL